LLVRVGTRRENHTRCGALQVAPQRQTVQRGTMRFGNINLHAARCRPERTGPAAREHGGRLPWCGRRRRRRRQLRRIRRIPRAGRSRLGLVGCGRRRGRAGGGVEQDRIELGVELGEPRVLAPQLLGFVPQLLHPQNVRDLPLLVFSPELFVFCPELLALVLQLLLPPIERDLSQLVVDDGSPVEHRQTAPEPGQGGVVLRFADQGRRCRRRGCGHGCTTRTG
jgi:hypothetical protein